MCDTHGWPVYKQTGRKRRNCITFTRWRPTDINQKLFPFHGKWVQDLIFISLLKFIKTDNSKDGKCCLGAQGINPEMKWNMLSEADAIPQAEIGTLIEL